MFELQGSFQVADMLIEFQAGEGLARYSVTMTNPDGTQRTHSKTCPQEAFLKALAIAVHNDGMPDYNKDYPDAESVQPNNPDFRWIP